MKSTFPLICMFLMSVGTAQEMMPCLDCGLPQLSFNRVDPSANLTVQGEYLYWKAYADTLDWAVTYTEYQDPTIMANVRNDLQVSNAKFSWDSAFRISSGFSICSWDNNFRWTYFNTSGEGSHVFADYADWGVGFVNASNRVVPIWPAGIEATADFVEHLSAMFRVQLNCVDWEFGKSLYLSRAISYRPFIGVRGARLTQRMRIKTNDQLTVGAEIASSKMGLKNTFLGVGPRLGVDGNWHINNYFSLYGMSAFSLLGGKFNLTENSLFNFGDDPSVFLLSNNQFTLHTFKPSLDFGFGLQLFYDFCWGIATEFNLGYEFHLWPAQTQLYRLYPGARAVKQVGDVGIHGLNLSGAIYF